MDGAMDKKTKLLVCFLGAFMQCMLAVPTAAAERGHGCTLRTHALNPCGCKDSLMNPTHQIWRGTDVVWQIPDRPKAILFLAHGMRGDAFGFFDPGPKCVQCSGLPETRRTSLEALRRRYAVVAMKSIDLGWVSWPAETSPDVSNIVSFLDRWRRQHALQHLPLVALGQSAGGFLVTSLTTRLGIDAVVLMCSEGQREVEDIAKPGQFPPAFFAYMNYNGTNGLTTMAAVEEAMAILAARNVPVAGKRLLAQRLRAVHFTERIRCMAAPFTASVVRACEAEGLVDDEGYLKTTADVDWRSIFWRWGALPFCEGQNDLCLVVDVEQELKMALALHGFSSDADEEIFSWLDSVLSSSSPSLPSEAAVSPSLPFSRSMSASLR